MTQRSLFADNPDATLRAQELGQSTQVSVTQQKAIAPATGRMEGRTDYTINPYTGCAFGCGYCYAAEFQQDAAKRESWGQWVRIKERAPRELERMTPGELNGKSLSFGTVTDPYQPLERKTRLTRRMLERVARDHEQVRVHIQTRGPLVPRDLDLLEEIVKRGGKTSVGMSIPTDSERIRRMIEPQAPGIPTRMEALAKVAGSGRVWAIASISPLVAIEDPADFARRLERTGAHHYWMKALELRPPRRDGPPRSATRETGWPKIAEILGCDPASVIPEYMSRYRRDSEALEQELKGVFKTRAPAVQLPDSRYIRPRTASKQRVSRKGGLFLCPKLRPKLRPEIQRRAGE